jgi:hypothetical protein
LNELLPAFEHSLFDTSIADIGIEFSELGIDSILSDGILKDIPIVSTIIGFGKFAQNIHDRNLMKQTLAFINEFNRGSINPQKKERYIMEIRENPKKLEEELGRVLVLLNKNVDIIKSKFEARFYSAYVDEKIDWDRFCELSDITDRLFFSDISNLKKAYESHGVRDVADISYKHDRLISVGLLVNQARISGGLHMKFVDSNEQQVYIRLTDVGNLFCDLAFEGA